MTTRACWCACAAIGAFFVQVSSQVEAAVTLAHGQSIAIADVMSGDHTLYIGGLSFTFIDVFELTLAGTNVRFQAYIGSTPEAATGFELTGSFGDAAGDSVANGPVYRYNVGLVPALATSGGITGNKLSFDGQAFGPGAYARIDTAYFDVNALPGQDLLMVRAVSAWGDPITPVPNSPALASDPGLFGAGPYTGLHVISNPAVFSAATGAAGFTDSLQTFSYSVPAPGGAGGFAALAWMVLRRPRRV